MRPRLAITTLLLAAAALSPGGAFAQASLEDQLNQEIEEAVQGGDVPQGESPVQPGEVPLEGDVPATEQPDATDEQPGAAEVVPDPDADLSSGTTPVPPAYLTAGPGAASQPVSAVAQLTEPDVSLPPLRIATLLAALFALLAIATAGVLRATGIRTAAHEPVETEPPRGVSKLGSATSGLADDMRDFLRRSR